MVASRILILSEQDLFAEAIRSLLASSATAPFVTVEHYQDDTLARVRELHPDIIILGDDTGLPATLLPALLDSLPETHIVRLSLAGDSLRVYEGHQLIAGRSQDLVNLVESLTAAGAPTRTVRAKD